MRSRWVLVSLAGGDSPERVAEGMGITIEEVDRIIQEDISMRADAEEAREAREAREAQEADRARRSRFERSV